MIQVRLLPVVTFAVSALLVLKLLGMTSGSGSFALGPSPAEAAGASHGQPAPEAEPSIEDPMIIGEPLDLAKEAEEMARQAEGAGGGHGGGHGAPAAGHGEAAAGHGAEPAAADAHGAPAAADGHGAEAAAEHGAPAKAEGHGTEASAEHGAPAGGSHGTEAAPADAGHGAPADAGHGTPAAGGHGEGATPGLSTVRPEEYQVPGSASEAAVLERLGERREALDKREQEITLRLKLLEAAERRLQKRVDELKAMETQLGGIEAASKQADPSESEQIKSLVSMYENMKPKAAAEVFNKLDLGILIAIARQMNPRKMSAILAAMTPERAGNLTVALAGDLGPRQIVVRTEAAEIGGPATTQAVPPRSDELPKIMPAPPRKP